MNRREFLQLLTGLLGLLFGWLVKERQTKTITQWVFDEKNGLMFAPNRKYHKVYLPQVQRGP